MDEQSLPLFDDAFREDAAARHGTRRPADSDRHLRAVRRLFRDVRRARDRSPQQTRAGQLICRHLIAILQHDEELRR